MKKGILICVLIAGVLVSTGCSGSRVKAPERVFEPEEAFLEIPHSSFEAEWLEGGMKDEDGHVYEEVYDFVLAMDRAVIPYTVSGKLIQTCEYNPSEGSWNVERRTEDVTQEMDLTKYRWKLENDPVYEYTETFIKTGPNTFETGEPDHPTGIHFTVDILSGGTNLKDESGRTNLPGGQWTARLYLESDNHLGSNFKGEAAIDLVGGFYGYNELRWVVTIDELKRVEKELNTTDEERANELQEGFRKSFPEADSFEVMDFELIQDCNKELASSAFGDVGVDAAAAAKDRDGALMGWVVNAHSKDSYMGNVAVSVAFESGGTIRGLEFLVLEDTPGLGMRASEDVFKEQFEGKGGEALTVTDSGNPGDSQIDAISGATITSKAVTNAVNGAMYYVHHYTEAGEQAL
ncbi:MAG: FMN-binding protein [Enterocloster bolteae]